MKIQRITLSYHKRGLLLVAVVFLLLAYFLGQESTLSDPLNLRPEVGTRGLGLSGAFISSADDATSPLWNPAGLATLQRGNLIYDLSQGAVSIAYPIKYIGTFGVNFLDLNRSDRFLVEHTRTRLAVLNSAIIKHFSLMQGGSELFNWVPALGIVGHLITVASGHKIMMLVCSQSLILTLLWDAVT